MAIQVKCHLCPNELNHQGALLFGPPDILGRVKKYHICTVCFAKIVDRSPELGVSEMPHGRRVG